MVKTRLKYKIKRGGKNNTVKNNGDAVNGNGVAVKNNSVAVNGNDVAVNGNDVAVNLNNNVFKKSKFSTGDPPTPKYGLNPTGNYFNKKFTIYYKRNSKEPKYFKKMGTLYHNGLFKFDNAESSIDLSS